MLVAWLTDVLSAFIKLSHQTIFVWPQKRAATEPHSVIQLGLHEKGKEKNMDCLLVIIGLE